jgi:hypothetical protein
MFMDWKGIVVAALFSARLCAATSPVIISEFMAENNGLILDSFGNASDWIEFQNTTGSPINLQGWSLTDDAADTDKWVLPAVILPPFGTRLIWASNANLRDPNGELHTNFALSKKGEYLGLYDASGTLANDYAPGFPAQYENIAYGYALEFATTNTTILVSNTSPVRAFCPTNDSLGTLWRQPAFNDSGWTNGLFSVGYKSSAPSPAWLSDVNLNLQSIAYGKPGVYLRAAFNLASAAAVKSLSFDMTYDDGAAIFINGTYACSANSAPFQTLSYTNYALGTPLGDPVTLAPTDISAVTNVLADGVNVLAVHLMNANASSSDLFLKPRLMSVERDMVVTNAPTFLISATPGTLNGGFSAQRLPQTVTYSVASGIFTTNFTITLSGTIPGQTIRYTTNGAEPSFAGGTLYAGPISVSASLHIRARVFDAVGRSSLTATAQYTFCATDSATLAFATSLPILLLRETDPLASGLPAGESTTYTACSAQLIEPVGGTACLTSAPALTSRAGIHIRGSSSSGFPKHPYALTFWGEDNDDKKVGIAGFPSGSDFALITCYNYDRTYMHDALLFDLSRQIGRYAPRTRWMEVFLLGNEGTTLVATNYAGLYVLEERIKAGDGRVPIDDIVSPAEIAQPNLSGSYLFKTDRNDADEFYWRTARNFPNSPGRYMVLAYPKSDTAQPEQCRYIVDAFNAFEDTVYGTDPMNPTNGVGTQIDLLSWADFHIYKMFSMDVDMFTLSTCFHKDRSGKIMAGPLWDFDRSLGPYGNDYINFPNVKRWDAWTFSPEPFIRGDFWGKLHAQPAFQRLYWDRWFELRRGAWSQTNLAATIVRLKSEIPEAVATRDYVRWGQWPTNDAFGRTHSGEVAWMTWFVTNHAAWIDQNLYAKCTLLKPTTLSQGSCVRPAGTRVNVTLTAPEGDFIRYTLDGSDPALWNNSASPAALTCAPGATITISSSALLFARAFNSANSRWGLAARAEYLIGARYAMPGDVQLSEIHYHPAMNDSFNHLPELNSRAYEFVEILNIAECDICLTGCRFPEGKPADELILGAALLKPGGHAVIARHSEAFKDRYGKAVAPIAYWLYGGLDDSSETVALLNRTGMVLDAIDYKTSGKWPKSADGDGDSINRPAFGLAEHTAWQAAVPTPGYGSYWEWFGLRGIASLESDDDGDGVANLMEYYTGADPQDPSDRGRSDMQGIHAGEDGLCVSYHQALDRPDVWALLEESEDLLEWRDTEISHLAVENTSNGYLWTFRLSADELAEYPRRYFRLRVWPATTSNSGGTLPPPL